jgi:arabinan endo-1,5-alpha-L-arabinosidase
MKDGDTYYVYSTGGNLPSITSKDMTTWVSGKEVLPNGTPAWARKDVPSNDGHDIWAPDLILINGLYYMYYAINGGKQSAIGLLTSPTLDPTASNYNWTDRGPVIVNSATDQYMCIDPAPYFDTAGDLWLSWGSGYIFKSWQAEIFEIRLDKTTGLRSDNVIHQVEYGHIEASYVYYHASYYYLFWNSGGCCDGVKSTYEIHVARSSAVTGPYVDKNGAQNASLIFIASNGDVHGPGQIGVLDQGSTSYFSYHYYNANSQCILGIGTLNWGSDGWPTAGAF